MAGAFTTVEFDDGDVQAMLQRLVDFGPEHGSLLLEDIGETLLNSTRDRAAREVGPDETPWVELSAGYAAWKKKKRPGRKILVLDEHMLFDMFSYQLDGPSALDLGTNAIYGAAQQWGYEPTGLPARPFLGVSAQDEIDIVEIIGEHLQAAVDGTEPPAQSAAV